MGTGHTGSGRAAILRLPRLSLLAAALLAVFLAAGAHSAHSSEPPTMRLDPAEIKHDGGPGFKVDVLIEGVTDLGGIKFEIRYDETRVNVAEIRTGPFLGSLGASVNCISQVLQGIASYACATIGGLPGPSGTGVLASIDFTVKPSPAGKTELFLQACGAADRNGLPITLNGCKDGSFTVNPTPGPPAETPVPPPVGGIAVEPDLGALAGAAEGGRVPLTGTLQNLTVLLGAVAIAAGAAGAIAAGAAGWFMRRRLAGHRA